MTEHEIRRSRPRQPLSDRRNNQRRNARASLAQPIRAAANGPTEFSQHWQVRHAQLPHHLRKNNRGTSPLQVLESAIEPVATPHSALKSKPETRETPLHLRYLSCDGHRFFARRQLTPSRKSRTIPPAPAPSPGSTKTPPGSPSSRSPSPKFPRPNSPKPSAPPISKNSSKLSA